MLEGIVVAICFGKVSDAVAIRVTLANNVLTRKQVWTILHQLQVDASAMSFPVLVIFSLRN